MQSNFFATMPLSGAKSPVLDWRQSNELQDSREILTDMGYAVGPGENFEAVQFGKRSSRDQYGRTTDEAPGVRKRIAMPAE